MLKNIYKNNEARTNEVCTKAVKCFMAFVLCVAVLGWIGIFSFSSY